jgi:2-keto-4-pentenoate hydratase/2-oxohepta-3-ene-1,7-dioic acid hydratase in catechol pathway
MRLASYDRGGSWRSAVVVGDDLVDARAAADRAGLDPGHGGWNTVRRVLSAAGDQLAALEQAARALQAEGEGIPVGRTRLGPPIPDPDKILCVGLNYAAHAAEGGFEAPPAPLIFAKFRNTLIGVGEPIRLPRSNPDRVDYEGEFAVAIGREAHEVSEEEALDHVAGWMPFNDVSARDLQTQTTQFTVGKTPDTFGPSGPFLVIDDALRNGGLTVQTRVNGELLQDGHSDELIFPVARLVAFLSSVITLVPGDIIVTGTPEGVGVHRKPPRFLKDGDVVEVKVNAEVLTNPVSG